MPTEKGLPLESREAQVSIVIPIHDEADNIRSLARELTIVMEQQPWTWECIWVDDGSKDQGLEVLGELASSDPRHCFIAFGRNAGKSAALWAGFSSAKGSILATLDGDGQNDPVDLPPLIRMVASGQTDMANGYRLERRDGAVRKASSLVANAFRIRFTGGAVRDAGCAIRAFRKDCLLSIPKFSGVHRFLPTLAALQGFRLAEIPVNHRPRLRGVSKYSINNRLWVGLFDTFGVMWLQRRGFRYQIKRFHGEAANQKLKDNDR
jgi:dolichol-phosphate mannosyltransferase